METKNYNDLLIKKLNQCINAIESSNSNEDERGIYYTPEIGISFVKSIKELIKQTNNNETN